MSAMTVRFWGTRGSIPTPGRATEKYGGNTTCLEVRYGDTVIVLDAGSGIREMSDSWAREFVGSPIDAHLLFTHLHWDHIQGFPFFSPGYQKGNHFVIYGEERPTGGIRDLLSGQMQGDYFPIPLAAMQADLEFRPTTEAFTVGPVAVRTFPLPHPGGALAYRLEAGGSVFVLATDCELDQVAGNRDELRDNHQARREYDAGLLEFLQGAQLLVVDCQYTDELYRSRVGWGHNPLSTVVDLCAQIRPDMAALFHHDPQSSDEAVTMMLIDAASRLEAMDIRDLLLFAGREGLTIKVETPQRPPVLPS